LREAGYIPDDHSPPAAFQADRQIAFGSDAELVIANDAGTSFAHPGPVTGFVLDARSGRVLNKATWRAGAFPYLFATQAGDYAVNTESGSTLYSPGLRTAKAMVPYSIDLASPDGTSFAAWKGIAGPHGLTYFLAPQSLKPSGVEYLDEDIDSICGDRAVSTSSTDTSEAVDVLTTAEDLFSYETRCSEPRPAFVSANVIAVIGCGHVDVVDVFGGRRFSHSTDAYHERFVGASRDGSRFVVAETFYGLGDEPPLRFERFTVIDVTDGAPILSVKVTQLRGRRRGDSGAALSPNGSLLAINSLGVVQLFGLLEGTSKNGSP